MFARVAVQFLLKTCGEEFSDDDGGGGGGGGSDDFHFRHCGASVGRRSRRLPIPVAMTQQIEELSSGSSSDNDDDDRNRESDKKSSSDGGDGHDVGGVVQNNETMTLSHPSAATTADISVAGIQQQQRHKLSLSSQYDHAIIHHELQQLQHRSMPITMTTISSDSGCRDLFREIELGLDQVCGTAGSANVDVEVNAKSGSSSLDATATASHIASTSPLATEGTLDKVVDDVDAENDYEEEWNEDDLAAIDLSVAMMSNMNRHSHQHACLSSFGPSSSSSYSSHSHHQQQHQQQVLFQQQQPSSSTAASSSRALEATTLAKKTIPLAPAEACQRSNELTPNRESNIDDCSMDDDDLWNDDDLAAIDLSVALTRLSLNSTSRPAVEEASNTMNSPAPSCDNVIASPNNIGKNEEIISDDDDEDHYFAEMDFGALDDTIVRHRQQQQQQLLMTQEEQHDGMQSQPKRHLPPPPPPTGLPLFNRHRHPIVCEQGSKKSLSFTRYIVQTLHEDMSTYTKTIGVSQWNSSGNLTSSGFENGRRRKGDQLDDLVSFCCDSQKTASSNIDDAKAAVIDGFIHLRGEWHHTACQPGDIIHLCSLSGDYLTDISALPVLHSDPPVGSDLNDDLILVLHPDELISPTIVSEAVQCPRLAVLRSRLGSTGMSSRSAVIGILRHELFERCLRERDASHKSAALFTREIIRNKADSLLGMETAMETNNGCLGYCCLG